LLKRIIIGPAYPFRGGISESTQALQNFFNKNGEVSRIVSYSLQYPKFLFPGKEQIMTDLEANSDNTFNLINTLNPISWFNTAKWIVKENPDYVVIRYWHPYFSICLSVIARILRKKSIFTVSWIDNVLPHESVPFQSYLSSLFLKSCDAFVVMSDSVKKDVINCCTNLNKPILISPHPVYNIFGSIIEKNIAKENIGISKSSIDNKDKYILFFGLIRKYKGLDLLLDVIASKKMKKMNIKLIIAGEFYDSKNNYINKINELNIKNRVILHDYYIKNKDVRNYFCASDIVVQPYISATQSGVSMVAYNFNKPLLLTNVGGLSEYVDHKNNGYLVNPNVEEIVEALHDYYVNDREESFTNSIKTQKSHYSWDNLAFQFDELYKKSKYD